MKARPKSKKLFITLIVLLILLAAGAVVTVLMLTSCNDAFNRHNYELSFNNQTLSSVTVGNQHNIRISPASFLASSDNQFVTYSLCAESSLPAGLSFYYDPAGPFISGSIAPNANGITMGANAFTVYARVHGSSAYTSADFSFLILPGIWGAIDYSFSKEFLETPFSSDNNIAVRVSLNGTESAASSLEARLGATGAWLPFSAANASQYKNIVKNLEENSTTNIYIRYAQTAQMNTGYAMPISITTAPEYHQNYFFDVDNSGNLLGFSSFFIATFGGASLTIPSTTNTGAAIVGISWLALSGILGDNNGGVSIYGEPRFNPIIVPSTIQRIIGTFNNSGISNRQVIIFESITPPTIVNPLPSTVPNSLVRGGRFIVPDIAISAYRTAMPAFTQAANHLPLRNIFPRSNIVNNYYIIADGVPWNVDGNTFPMRALVSYFGNSNTAIVPDGVSVILPHAFSYANTVQNIVLPFSLRAIASNAFSTHDLAPGLQTIFLINTPTSWQTISANNFPFANVLFYGDGTGDFQWRFCTESGLPLAWD